ncbi:MAG TPA: hypothetical protein VE646_06985 [Actinomycetota bacterium]|nr:hypothetical protein [Actinomycetota bacterium]
MSAFNTPGHRFEALRDSRSTPRPTASFTHILSGSFPTTPPRPATPDLRYRRFALDQPVEASFLRFVAEHPQSDTAGAVQVAEVQAFGSGDVVVQEQSGGGVDPVHDEGLALVPTADAQLTLNLMLEGACLFPPPTQGVDAWVTELPDGYQDGTSVISVRPESDLPQARADVDVFFLSSDCQLTGSVATASAGESGTVPQGTWYVVTELYTSVASRIVLDAGRVG